MIIAQLPVIIDRKFWHMQYNDKKMGNRNIWPANESPCIWMEAGIIDYKLCDKNFDCENCPFDTIIKSGDRKDEKFIAAKKESIKHGWSESTEKQSIIANLMQKFQARCNPNLY